jgi:hypothetical protein
VDLVAFVGAAGPDMVEESLWYEDVEMNKRRMEGNIHLLADAHSDASLDVFTSARLPNTGKTSPV